ncbi:unnamed protein product [Urochloa humidicola]
MFPSKSMEVAMCGERPCIPRSIDAPASCSKHNDSTPTLQHPLHGDDDETMAQKKAHLNRMDDPVEHVIQSGEGGGLEEIDVAAAAECDPKKSFSNGVEQK